ncbi:putative ATP-grasp superfamily ATP-dependent carboligase [Marmoricola sp. OAE513]|uniref:proteasome assembly chaperone family protein n=1 Tax=Marmoricola sp. OAE513 TaxID=2817894 RepID=UPI001AE764EB
MTQARFVHIVDDVPELDGLSDGPVMVTALDGFLDAGNASALAIGHLLESSSSRVVASFEVDEFFDYRARRPPMTFLEDHYGDYDAPRLVVRLLHDQANTPYLLLSGPEPDMRWEGFAEAVRQVIEHFDVRLTVSLGSVPMAVPHTRPIQLTNHATSKRLLISSNVWAGEIRIPSSAQSLLELRLGEWGHDATGFVAHIPHYVAQFGYPEAASAMLTQIGAVTGLRWDVSDLDEAADDRRVEIASQVADSDEVRAVVEGLEQQYDAFHSGAENLLDATADALGDALRAGEGLPTGEELGAQFEEFLAGLDQPDDERND